MSTQRSGGSRPADAWRRVGELPALVVLVLAVNTVVALLADVLGLGLLSSRAASAVVLLVSTVGSALVLRRLGREDDPAPVDDPRPGRTALLASLPSLVLVGYLLASFIRSRADRVEWFLNGDHVRHLVMVADLQENGALSYADQPYPRAWHTTVAMISTALGSGQGDVVGLVDVMSTAAWLLSALLALATASVGLVLGRRLGLAPSSSAVAAAVAGAATLWPSFLGNYQALGLEASLVAAVVVAVCVREVLARLGSSAALVVSTAAVVVMGHTWQLVLPVAALCFAVNALAFVWRGSALRWVIAIGLAAAAGVAVVASFGAVVQKVGVRHAVVADVAVPVPLVVVVVVAVSGGWLAWSRRGDRWVVVSVVLTLAAAVTGVVLAWRLGISPLRYYPGKLLWHTAIAGLPIITATGGLAWARLGARGRPAAAVARAALGAGAALLVLAAVVFPAGAVRGSWSTADATTVLRLLTAPGAERAQVVWSTGPLLTDTITRILLDAGRPDPEVPDGPQASLSVDEECTLLASAARPVVVTDHTVGEARARYACVPGVEVLVP